MDNNWFLKTDSDSGLLTKKFYNSIEDFPQDTFGFIYMVTHKPSGKSYIGKKSLFHNVKKKLTKKELAEQTGPGRKSTTKVVAKESDAAVYSPTVINASIEQCHWKQMWNWGKGLRKVKWIDFQSPLLRRDILEKIQQFPNELIYGWGLDFYTGCIAETLGLKTIISDTNTITHMNSLTFKENKINIGINEFCRNAETNMNQYFMNSEYKSLYSELRTYGEIYNI